LAVLIAYGAKAQEKEKKEHSVSISNKGILIDKEQKDSDDKSFEVHYFMMDLGFNTILDNTNYKSTAAQNFVHYDTSFGSLNNKDAFTLRTGKSINVNIYPVMAKFRLLGADKQKIYLSTGAGLQFYNFRFSKNISYRNEPTNFVTLDTVKFTKNKLSFAYLTIPLGFTFKTKLAEKAWLVYGFGITGGYRIDSWTKQISDERGKDKNHDAFNFKDFNSCLTAEFGVDDYFRFYASYQVTPLHENALEQYPLSLGFRFGGI
jgi:hypothetical protein